MDTKRSLTIMLLATLAVAAVSAAEHHGNVKFGGLPVPGATVTATQGEKRLSTITSQEGGYSLADLADGAWKIRVEKLLFEPLEKEVAVAANTAATEWELQLASSDGLLAAAPKVAAQASSSKKSKASKNTPVQAANTSTAFQRASLNAAPTAPKQDEPVAPASVAEVAPLDGFLINGSVNNGAASPFGQAAAFGNARNRQKLYNGEARLLFDTSAWNARPYSMTGQNTPKADYTHMQGSLVLNGPLRIPRLIVRNAPQVTLSYQWTRNRDASTTSGRMPTEAERGGDLSQTRDAMGKVVTASDPTNGAPFIGNAIPSSRISPQAALLLGLYPRPNYAGGATGYNYQVPLVGSTHQDSLKVVGSKIVGKNYLEVQTNYQRSRGDSTTILGFLDTTQSQAANTSVSWNRRLAARASSTFAIQLARSYNRVLPYFADRYNISALAGITGNDQTPRNWGPPTLNFSGGVSPLSDTQNSITRKQDSAFTATINNSHGSHNFTLGGDIKRQQLNLLAQQDARGSFTFNGAAAGVDFAGFLLGIPDASSIAFGNADKYFRSSTFDAYAADDWRLAGSLTINAGIRWEYTSPTTERYGRLVNLDVTPGFRAVKPVVATAATGPLTGIRYPNSLMEPRKGAVAPRIGISWRPLSASSIVVRAGYGIYYDAGIYSAITTRMAQQAPLSKSLSVQNSAANPLTLANGFNAAPNVEATTFGVDPRFQIGYAQNWRASIESSLPFSLVATAEYLGIKGTHAQQQFLPNTFPSGVTNHCSDCPTGFSYLVSNGDSRRHSGQFQLRRRLRSGVTAQMSYTFSKALDNAALGGQGSVIAQDWLNLDGERGRSDFDQRHLLVAQAQYTTGMGLGGGTLVGGWAGRLFKDWTAVTQATVGSGRPLSPTFPSLVGGTGYSGSVRPDYTGVSIYDAPAGRFLNPAAVTAPQTGHWGNAGRNSITGPSQLSINTSLARTFRVGDHSTADFRIESSNPLNHVTYSSWNTSAMNAQFGLPTAANAMRRLQTSVRVRF